MTEYRCTRNQPYQHNCIGRDNISCRQGYYIEASSPEEALRIMAEDFPNDTAGFTVQDTRELL